MARKVWGVDSVSRVTETLLDCVKDRFGLPKYWGRYLNDIPNVSEGLTKREISRIRNKGIKLLLIYNDFQEAVGYAKGQVAARNAIFHARKLGIPKNIVLFANVERYFNVDADWLRAWVETIYPTGYRPGFYHDPLEGPFSTAYCKAVQDHAEVAKQAILWSAKPERGITKERNAPTFKPKGPPCKGNLWAWQYGRDAAACPVNTNLADARLLNHLY